VWHCVSLHQLGLEKLVGSTERIECVTLAISRGTITKCLGNVQVGDTWVEAPAIGHILPAGQPFFSAHTCRQYFTDHTNFDHFGYALLTLARVATCDAWASLHHDASMQPPHCDRELNTCGVHYVVSAVYFTSFVIIVNMVMINLVVSPGCSVIF
jgi:hypothetical protein